MWLDEILPSLSACHRLRFLYLQTHPRLTLDAQALDACLRHSPSLTCQLAPNWEATDQWGNMPTLNRPSLPLAPLIHTPRLEFSATLPFPYEHTIPDMWRAGVNPQRI